MRRMISLVAALALLLVSGSAVLAQPAQPEEGCDYFEETGHNLCEPFQSFWTLNGELPVFGFPITEAGDELNPDLNEELLTQWFERERMEYHPENAGTVYEVLLGRLGNEVLLDMGLNWFTFPKADPSAEHYFPETGHAIAPEFYDYWSSHGLDLGDEGTSFAESLALFGYPISEVSMETNSSGDTVPTQWFERARFELHGDLVLLGLLGNELIGEVEPPVEPVGEVIVDGISNPRGLFVGSDGLVYGIDSGIPTENCFEGPGPGGDLVEICYGYTSSVFAIDPSDGSMTTVVSGLPEVTAGGEGGSVQDVVVALDGTVYGTIGLGGDPADREATYGDFGNNLGWIFMSDGEGGWETVIDIAAYEGLENPDGGDPEEGGIDSNPYSLAMDGAGGWVVSDAGGNDLLHVDTEGNIGTLAVFPDQMVAAPALLGLPDGAMIPMQAVPTGTVMGPDGAFYVGELTGFPFVPGAARVWRVTSEGDSTVYADGFTNILDVAFDGVGNLFVLEGVAGGLLNADPSNPASAAAQIVKVMPDGTQEDVPSDGLIFATGLAMGPDGTAYVSNFGVMPGMGQVVAIEGVGEPFPEGPALTVRADGLVAPRGLIVNDNGDIYVTQAGDGGDTCQVIVTPDGEAEACFGYSSTVELISADGRTTAVAGISSVDLGEDTVGAQDVAMDADGLLHTVVGLGADPAARADYPVEASDLGWIVSAAPGSSPILSVDVAVYETVNNPDNGELDSNPFSLVSDGASGWVVSDAGANALLHIHEDNVITTLAVFADRMVDAPPFLGLPEGAQMPMQAVPTGVVMGPDGAFYVGELTGFPFVPGAARIWRVTLDGEASVYAEGFTNIVDVAFDSEGNLYALELAKNGLLSEDVSSAVMMVSMDGGHTEVASAGLTFATGLAIGADDTFYVSNFGVMLGMGQVVSFTLN